MNLSIHSISFSSHSVESGLISLSIMYDNLIQAWCTHAGGRPVCPLGGINDIYSSFHRRAFVIISPLILFSASNRKYINTCFLKKRCSFLMLPQAYLQSCEAEAENMLSIWKMGTGEWLQEMFLFEGEPGCKILLQISRVQCFWACWIGALFQPWKMTGIFCANWVQMWDWISQITQILSCLHIEFHLQTMSNFQIVSYSFEEVAKPCLLPGWWEGTVFGKQRLCWPCSVPAVGKRAWSRAHPSFCAVWPSLHPWGCTTVDAHTCTWGWAEGHQVPYALWRALPGWLCCEPKKMRHNTVSLRLADP